MDNIHVTTPNKDYDIVFRQSFHDLAGMIEALNKNYSRIMIITDSNVGSLYAEELTEALAGLKLPVMTSVFPAGEAYKHNGTINGFYEKLIENRYDRKTLILALGGGVAGDMAGFTAATYMRGVDFIQIPTTLLAQVDSSIGGKTGIDYNGYKNIVGAFWQPELVYINTSTLKTLPEEEFACGMGEALKHGFIKDGTYLEWMKTNREAVQSLEHEAISELIRRSCHIKAAVVSLDEREQGVRALLNFGHTIGHAIERLKEFSLLHGQCVALGMIASLNLSVRLGDISESVLRDAKQLFLDYGLPVKVTGLTVNQVYDQLFFDKKTRDSVLTIVMIKSVGNSYQNRSLTEKQIKEGLETILK